MTSTKRRPFPLSLSPGVTEDFLAALLKTKHSALSYLLRDYQAHHEGQPRAQVWAYSGPLVLQNFTSLPIINQNQRKSGKERKTSQRLHITSSTLFLSVSLARAHFTPMYHRLRPQPCRSLPLRKVLQQQHLLAVQRGRRRQLESRQRWWLPRLRSTHRPGWAR